MSDLYFALDFVTNAIQKSFEQHDYQTCVALKNSLIKVANSEDFSRLQTSNRILRYIFWNGTLKTSITNFNRSLHKIIWERLAIYISTFIKYYRNLEKVKQWTYYTSKIDSCITSNEYYH